MLLLYGMTAEDPQLQDQPGVRGAKIDGIAEAGVHCIFSEFNPQNSTPESLTQDALALHTVLQQILRQQTVLPFRFPTLLADEAALRVFALRHGAAYAAELGRLKNSVQAEVRITRSAEIPASSDRPASGTEYMKRKQSAMQAVDALASELLSRQVREHRRRTLPTSGNEQHIKLTCLLEKDDFHEFKMRVNAITLAAGITLRLTGPWPPADFANCYPEAVEVSSP